jgi:hypothetical protein
VWSDLYLWSPRPLASSHRSDEAEPASPSLLVSCPWQAAAKKKGEPHGQRSLIFLVSSYVNFSSFMGFDSRSYALLLCRGNLQATGIDSQRSGKTFSSVVTLEIYGSIVATGSSLVSCPHNANSGELLVPLAWLAAHFAFASVRVSFRYLHQHPFILPGS